MAVGNRQAMEDALLAPSLEAARKQLDGNPDEKAFFIADHVFLGTRFGAGDRALLDALQIRAVVNLTAGRTRIPNYFEGSSHIEYLHLELADELLSNPSQAIPHACRAIHRWGQERKRVLVHCQAGLSRSATAVVAWLVRHKGLSLAESAALLTERRGRRPKCNPSFWCYLAALERTLKGWPDATPPSFDFTPWLVEDLKAMGMNYEESRVVTALQQEADWVDFSQFYTAFSGWGMKTLMVAQRVAQQNDPDVRLACKAAGAALELLDVFHSWAAMQAFCLRVLHPLVAHSDSKPSEHIVYSGGVIKALNAMRAHRENAEVQEAGCALLAYLGTRSEAFVGEICFLRGVGDVVLAMSHHPAVQEVQTTGCITLLTLADSAEGKARISQAGGIQALLSAMRAHKGLPKLQEFAVRALVTLATAPQAAWEILHSGGVEMIMAAQKEHVGDAGIQHYAGEALDCLLPLMAPAAPALDLNIAANLYPGKAYHQDDKKAWPLNKPHQKPARASQKLRSTRLPGA